jgi:hypothetical protein
MAAAAALVALGPTVVLAVAHAPTSAGQWRAPRRVALGRDAVDVFGKNALPDALRRQSLELTSRGGTNQASQQGGMVLIRRRTAAKPA